jgi:methylenetetrahydrofolate dehydrogenase (NADP+)/methenyltetrahydrofolate cyclohydrolase
MSPSHKSIKGSEVAAPIIARVKNKVEALRETGWVPHLASIEVGTNPAASIYIRNQARLCDEVGIEFDNRQYPQEISQPEICAAIRALNVDPRVTGIILQRPVPPHLNLEQLQMAIHPSKDVEGMHPSNIGKVVYGDYVLGPCTSLASVEILRSTGLTLRGLEVVVVGHSEIVGKPIALYLLAELSTVTICHHGTHNLSTHTRRADALFVAVGKPGLITGDMVKPGAAVIDIGINQIEVEAEQGQLKKKTVGDVDFEGVHEVAGWITPVPGGVGPVTLAMLVRNTVAAVERTRTQYEKAMLG